LLLLLLLLLLFILALRKNLIIAINVCRRRRI
jgi:hypothetical protein